MKKIIWAMVLVLALVYAALTILGRGGEYAAERILYRAEMTAARIASNPDVVPPRLVDSIESDIEKLLKKYPNTEAAKTANVKLAEFYIAYKRYDQALAQLDKVIKKYDKNTAMLSSAYFLKGVAYEKQDKWSSALKEYHTVRDKYPNTQLGMQIPIYIANYYSMKGREAQAQEAYSEAAGFYSNIEKENSKKALGYMASLLLVQTYLRAGNFGSAAVVVESTLDKYFSQMALTQLLPLVEYIIVTKLNNPTKAVEIYKTIISKSKNEKLNKVLQTRIDALLKDKNSDVVKLEKS